MNDSTPDNLESRLAALSRPPTEPTTLWRAALEVHRAKPAKRSVIARIGPWIGLAAAVILVAVFLIPAQGRARHRPARHSAVWTPDLHASIEAQGSLKKDSFDRAESQTLLGQLQQRSASEPQRAPATAAPHALTSASLESAAADALAPSPRLVARRADLSLRVPDVREAFLKAQHATNPALGEFVEDSKITGEGPAAAADLTLRIASTRLAAALDELRALGVVVSEISSGDDVTNQAVDLDARLRNERRVEEEILQLLDTRKDAPLPDVLKLRDSLTTIRGSIERMDAQRATLTRMVDLSTIIIFLRPDAAAPAVPPSKGFVSDLTEQTSIALAQGSRRLAGSLAWTIERAVGGALTWATLALLTILGIGITRRLIRFAAFEPAPRLHS